MFLVTLNYPTSGAGDLHPICLSTWSLLPAWLFSSCLYNDPSFRCLIWFVLINIWGHNSFKIIKNLKIGTSYWVIENQTSVKNLCHMHSIYFGQGIGIYSILHPGVEYSILYYFSVYCNCVQNTLCSPVCWLSVSRCTNVYFEHENTLVSVTTWLWD